MTELRVEVVGLKELRKGLKAMDEQGVTEELKDAHFRIGSNIVAAAKGRSSGVSKLAGSAAETLSAGRTVSGARIRYGGVGYAMGAEFGAYSGQPRFNVGGSPPRHGQGWNQFKGWRGTHDGGYFLYPTIRDKREETIDAYARDLDRMLDKFVPK